MNPKLLKKTLNKILALLYFLILPVLFYTLTAYFMAAAFRALLYSMEEGGSAALILEANLPLLYSGSAAILAGTVLGYLYHRLKKNAAPQYFLPARKRKLPVPGYFSVILFGSFGAVFFNLLLELSRLPELFPSSGTIEAVTEDILIWLQFLVVCLILPAVEELIFRGLGYFGLRRFFAPVPASLLSAALFGVFHGNAPQTLYGFCMGLLLAHTAESCQNLSAPIFFHCAANFVSFTLLTDPASQRLLYSIPILGLSGIGCAYLFYRIQDLNPDIPR